MLGFGDAGLFEEEIGKEAVVVFDGGDVALAELFVELAVIGADGFADADGFFEEDDGDFGLVLVGEYSADVVEKFAEIFTATNGGEQG